MLKSNIYLLFCLIITVITKISSQSFSKDSESFEKGFETKNDDLLAGSGSENSQTSEEPTTIPEQLSTTVITEVASNDILRRIQDKPAVNSAIDAILILVVIQTMLGLGCTMDLSLIKEHLYNPTSIGIAAACQFGIMPLIAFIMAKIFALEKVAALAVLVTGCCPGGNLSNLLTYFLYGDMNLSILMSTSSTLLALICMPLCLFIYGSGWLDLSTIGRMIPFGGVILSLVLTLIPVAVGIAIKSRYEKIADTILKISLFSLLVSFVALMTLSIILLGTSLFTAISGSSYTIAFMMPLIGYGSGYLLASGFRLTEASKRTVAIETGCQNSQLSSTILKMAFTTQTMKAYYLFPIYYAVFQGLEGLALILIFRAYRRYYADSVAVPTSRITYDKFDGELDGEDVSPKDYRNISSQSSTDSLYGKLKAHDYSENAYSGNTSQKWSSDNRYATTAQRKESFGDKSSLIPQSYSSGVGSYGGVNAQQ